MKKTGSKFLRWARVFCLSAWIVFFPMMIAEAKVIELGTASDTINILGTLGLGLDQPEAQMQITAPTGEEALRLVSASNWSPLNIRNSADTADIFRVDQSGTLATGTIPWARLSSFPSACTTGQYVSAVGGTLTCSTPQGASQWTTNVNDIYFNTGKVGIGTTTPAEALTVTGNIAPTVNSGGSLGTSGKYWTTSYIAGLNMGSGQISSISAINGSTDLFIKPYSASYAIKFGVGSTEYARMTGSGDIGIGTTSPAASLHVNNGIYFKGGNGDVNESGTRTALDALTTANFVEGEIDLTPSQFAKADIFGNGIVSLFNSEINQYEVTHPGYLNDVTNQTKMKRILGKTIWPICYLTTPEGDCDLATGAGLSYGIGLLDSGLPAIKINESGNVGIGTTSPAAFLDIYGLAKMRNYSITQPEDVTNKSYVDSAIATATSTLTGFWDGAGTGNNEHIWNLNFGNVGIGTTTPNNKLQVVDLIDFNDTDFNSKLGYQAGKNIVSGAQYNTFVGYQTGLSSATQSTNAADNNSAFGYQALRSNTTGRSNVAVGANSLDANTTGTENVAIGYAALNINSSGGYNTAIGTRAMEKNATGAYNVAIGFEASRYITTGQQNATLGYESLKANTTGIQNAALGYNALNSIIGDYNSGFGSQALMAVTSGNRNSALGMQAGKFIADGITENITVNDSLFLGANTKSNADNQTNQIVIGYDAIGLGSNSVVLGNANITTTALRGSVGIGTTTPATGLHLTGVAPAFRIEESGAQAAKSASFYSHWATAGSDVAQLSVNRNPSTGAFVNTNRTYAQLAINSGADGTYGFFQFFNHNVKNNFGTGAEKMRIAAGVSIGSNYVSTDPGAGSLIVSGNVGIGTTSPATVLDVYSLAKMRNYSITQPEDIANKSYVDTAVSAVSGGTSVWGGTTTGAIYNLNSGSVGVGLTNPAAKLHVNESTVLGSTLGNSQILTRIAGAASNNFMENTWLYRDAAGSGWDTARLHNGISVDASFLTPGTDTKTWWERDPYNNIQSWGDGASTYLTINAGNVGIGTLTPGTYKLYVVGNTYLSGTTYSTGALYSAGDIYTTGSGDDLWLGSSSQSSANFNAYATGELNIDADSIPISLGEGQDADIYYDGTNLLINPRIVGSGSTIFAAGDVGIGTSTPASKIHAYDSSSGPIVTLSGLNTNYRGLTIKDTANAEQWFYGSNDSNNFVVRRSGSTDYLMIDSSTGYVGIGTTSPSERLSINGNIEANAFYYSSDRRLKDNIKPLKNSLSIIKKLNPVSFNWIEDGTASQGFIAQDLEKVIPVLVKTNSESGLKSVQYANLTAILTAGVKEQQSKIERLETEVEILKSRLNNLEK